MLSSMTVNQTGEQLLKWQVPLGCRSRTFQFPSVAWCAPPHEVENDGLSFPPRQTFKRCHIIARKLLSDSQWTPCISIAHKAPVPVKMAPAENITRHQLLLQSLEAAILDNFDRDDVSSPKNDCNCMSTDGSCLSQDINEEIEIPESWIGEFARVKLWVSQPKNPYQSYQLTLPNSIPETPQKKIKQKRSRDSSQPVELEDQDVQVRIPLRSERKHKKRRTESIRSTQGTEHSENLSGTG